MLLVLLAREREREREAPILRTIGGVQVSVVRPTVGTSVSGRNLSLCRRARPRLRSDGYERTPVFLGSTCFVLRHCADSTLFFFRRTPGERDGNPYFLPATFLHGLTV